MLFFGILLLCSMVVSFAIFCHLWFKREWDRISLVQRGGYILLPGLPFVLLLAFQQLYSPPQMESRIWLATCGTFALVVSGINTYRSLWTVLLNLRLRNTSAGAGRLLLKISLSLMYTITAIVTLFGLAYALVAYLSGPTGPNMIMEHVHQLRRLDYWDLHSYFYFSSVTYFALGYGDFLPRGTVMVGLIYLESLLGYINSGILIAYGFNLFTKLDR